MENSSERLVTVRKISHRVSAEGIIQPLIEVEPFVLHTSRGGITVSKIPIEENVKSLPALASGDILSMYLPTQHDDELLNTHLSLRQSSGNKKSDLYMSKCPFCGADIYSVKVGDRYQAQCLNRLCPVQTESNILTLIHSFYIDITLELYGVIRTLISRGRVRNPLEIIRPSIFATTHELDNSTIYQRINTITVFKLYRSLLMRAREVRHILTILNVLRIDVFDRDSVVYLLDWAKENHFNFDKVELLADSNTQMDIDKFISARCGREVQCINWSQCTAVLSIPENIQYIKEIKVLLDS